MDEELSGDGADLNDGDGDGDDDAVGDVGSDEDGATAVYRCNLCPYSTTYEHSSMCHQRLDHDSLVTDDGDRPVPGKKRLYMCVHCPHMATERPNLRMHMNRQHLDTEGEPVCVPALTCPHCDFTTMLKAALATHLTTVHAIPTEVPTAGVTIDRVVLTSRPRRWRGMRTYDDAIGDSDGGGDDSDGVGDGSGGGGDGSGGVGGGRAGGDDDRLAASRSHPSVKVKTSNGLLQCVHCYFHCKKWRLMLDHQATMHGDNPPPRVRHRDWQQCPHCTYRSNEVSNFNRHVASRHPEHLPGSGISKKVCKYCKYSSFSLTNLQRHEETKHGSVCGECGFATDCDLSLEVHRQKEHVQQVFDDGRTPGTPRFVRVCVAPRAVAVPTTLSRRRRVLSAGRVRQLGWRQPVPLA